jgi:predicted nucleic acid-binding protein
MAPSKSKPTKTDVAGRYSEDMQHGHTIGGLTIANPFQENTA